MANITTYYNLILMSFFNEERKNNAVRSRNIGRLITNQANVFGRPSVMTRQVFDNGPNSIEYEVRTSRERNMKDLINARRHKTFNDE